MSEPRRPLFAVQWFLWKWPVLWRVGNLIADARFWLYHRTGWEWL